MIIKVLFRLSRGKPCKFCYAIGVYPSLNHLVAGELPSIYDCGVCYVSQNSCCRCKKNFTWIVNLPDATPLPSSRFETDSFNKLRELKKQ